MASSCLFSTKKVTRLTALSPSWACWSAALRACHQATISSMALSRGMSLDCIPLVYTWEAGAGGDALASFSKRSLTVLRGIPNSRLISVWVLPWSWRVFRWASSISRTAMKVSLTREYPQNLHDKPQQYERHRDIRAHHPLE